MTLQPYIVLRNPSRQSSAIKVIEGEIEFFTPTAANGGVVRISDAGATPGTFLGGDELKKAGVRVMYLTPESYAAKREEAAAERDDPTGPWSDDFANQMKLLARLTTSTRMPLAIFYVDDPRQLVVNLELQAKDGRVLDRGGTLTNHHPRLRAVYVDGPLPADAQLTMHLAMADSLKTYPFKLENVPLP